MEKKEVRSLKSNLFANFETSKIKKLFEIKGGTDPNMKKTKSSTTGWTCKDDKDGNDEGPWTNVIGGDEF